MLSVSGCARDKPPSPSEGICDGLRVLFYEHVDALIEDGGPKSLETGERLVAGYDGGCPL